MYLHNTVELVFSTRILISRAEQFTEIKSANLVCNTIYITLVQITNLGVNFIPRKNTRPTVVYQLCVPFINHDCASIVVGSSF